MHFSETATPALILDRSRLQSNIDHLTNILAPHSVQLRPHFKTCKSLEIANLILKPGSGGITVSTLHEAEYFLSGGYTDILYAVSIVPQKLRHVKKLQEKGAKITLLLDNLLTAQEVSKKGLELNTVFPCLIEIDCDGKRAGLTSDAQELISIARCLHEQAGTQFEGLMSHSGGTYSCNSVESIREMAEIERLAVVHAGMRIKSEGLPCPTLSIGSTPAAYFSNNFEGITELRAGVYVFHDMVMEALQVCETSDIAISVLATVISHKKDRNRLLIDAGSLALSADPGKKNNLGNIHFGQVCALEDCKPYSNLWITSTNQEHGLISLDHTSLSFEDFPIGGQVRILPNHACITAAAYPGYHVIEEDTEISAYWERCNGW